MGLSTYTNGWSGLFPPGKIFRDKEFKGIALDPPDFEPGSWTGAGKAIFEEERGRFLLTARPRKAEGGVRGLAAEIHSSDNGEDFQLVKRLHKEEASEISGLEVQSIEGSQLLKSPLTDRWHLYLSVDVAEEFVWGGLYWQTLLLTAQKLEGPWKSEGLVLQNDGPYDANQARDATIDIVDGRWFCIYKAKDGNREERPGLALSQDGIDWRKEGVLTVEGSERLAFLSGTLFPGCSGPLFIGLELIDKKERRDLREGTEKEGMAYADRHGVPHGSGRANFVAYQLDYRSMNLETVFRERWRADSEYEHKEHPLLGYSSLVYDPMGERMLTYVEAIDGQYTEKMGLNETVERLLVYETKL